jgi:hypothetical protein
MQPVKPHIDAEVRFLTTVEGGRKRGGIGQDYRPSHDFGHSVLNEGRHMYPGRDLVQIGETVVAEITFLAPEYQRGWLSRSKKARKLWDMVLFGTCSISRCGKRE